MPAPVEEAPITVSPPVADDGPDHPGADLLSKGPLAALESAPPAEVRAVAPTPAAEPAAAEPVKVPEPVAAGGALLVPPPPTVRSGPSPVVLLAIVAVVIGVGVGAYFMFVAT